MTKTFWCVFFSLQCNSVYLHKLGYIIAYICLHCCGTVLYRSGTTRTFCTSSLLRGKKTMTSTWKIQSQLIAEMAIVIALQRWCREVNRGHGFHAQLPPVHWTRWLVQWIWTRRTRSSHMIGYVVWCIMCVVWHVVDCGRQSSVVSSSMSWCEVVAFSLPI